MDNTRIGSDILELLSKITGQPLRQEDLSPPIVFLAPLVAVLTGVMFADKNVTDEEKQRWQTTIKNFIPSEQSAMQLTQQLSKGTRAQKIYAKSDELLKLTQPLSISERLLLLGLGYEMAVADGQMDDPEKQYLRSIAKCLNVSSSHVNVLETGLVSQNVDLSALTEVRSLLDPARFHELDAIFVNAANNLLEALPAQPESASTQPSQTITYKQLEAFQQQCIQLDNLCLQFQQVIRACMEKKYLTHEPLRKIDAVSEKLKSQRFRVAVVGEFSQGKSTLLNALLGEKVQPTRAIPCSGVVTTLRYGGRKRVICRYKDGREVEIPINEYKEKAAIPREVAQEQRLENLVESDLDEIIFEHPELALCKSGVEIIDSPGLNEHPDRTAITQKLLQETDAAIFLTNATRLLTEKEKELIQDIRLKLNGNQAQKPAKNLFLLVNFIDLLEEVEDRQDVAQRLEGFVRNENLLPDSANRVHYISAKAALKASLRGIEDEHLYSFKQFTRSLEQFLTFERGALQIAKAGREINCALEASFDGLTQAESLLDGKVNLSESEKQKILEQIGEVVGRDVKIKQLAKKLRKETAQKAADSYKEWLSNLPKTMKDKSKNWHSDTIWNQFSMDLLNEIDQWGRVQFYKTVLNPYVALLDSAIQLELKAIQSKYEKVDLEIDTELTKQFDFGFTTVNHDFGGGNSSDGFAAAAAAAPIVVAAAAPIVVAAAAAAAAAALFGFGSTNSDRGKETNNDRILEEGLKKFNETSAQFSNKLDEIINSRFDKRVESANRVIEQEIGLYENLLEQQEKSHAATLEEREQQKAWILQQRQELEQLKQKFALGIVQE